jgi:hypothetical protein
MLRALLHCALQVVAVVGGSAVICLRTSRYAAKTTAIVTILHMHICATRVIAWLVIQNAASFSDIVQASKY